MKIQILSDLHLEFHADGGRKFVADLDPSGVDVLVVAGDLATLPALGAGLRGLCARYRHVLYVTGNHEYYGSRPREVHEALGALAVELQNLHWLDCRTAILDGVRFAGATLWFPERPDAGDWSGMMDDFQVIEDFVPWVYREHERAVNFLSVAGPGADVVVTHHLPSTRCIAPQYATHPLNRFFVGDVEELMQGPRAPSLWIHGHSHESLDVRIGGTRVVRNPYGYAGEALNDAFARKLVVDLEPRHRTAHAPGTGAP